VCVVVQASVCVGRGFHGAPSLHVDRARVRAVKLHAMPADDDNYNDDDNDDDDDDDDDDDVVSVAEKAGQPAAAGSMAGAHQSLETVLFLLLLVGCRIAQLVFKKITEPNSVDLLGWIEERCVAVEWRRWNLFDRDETADHDGGGDGGDGGGGGGSGDGAVPMLP
jgi:hypothetical protein